MENTPEYAAEAPVRKNIEINLTHADMFAAYCSLLVSAPGVQPEDKAANAYALFKAGITQYKRGVAEVLAMQKAAAVGKELYVPPLPSGREEEMIAKARELANEVAGAAIAQEGDKIYADMVARALDNASFAEHDFCPYTLRLPPGTLPGVCVWVACGKHSAGASAQYYRFEDKECVANSAYLSKTLDGHGCDAEFAEDVMEFEEKCAWWQYNELR